ncbi:MAG: hypothetical protein JSW50_02675 [Candidatus Latescibacterota bacterium]|nr:MAG: hypothetical protein JSW50_02675 [Candidatus Latescibacterota bacterium]
MKRILMIIFTIVLFGALVPSAAELPEKVTYLFYIQGEYAGKCVVGIGEDGDAHVFESTSEIKFEEYKLQISSRTEIEKESLRPRFFRYEGVRSGMKFEGTLWTDGDSISADNALDGEHFKSGERMEGPVYLFENYVSDHQIVLAWAIDKATDPYLHFSVLLPSDFMSFPTVATLDSEIEIATSPKPTVCNKYAVAMKNSAPYFTYFDPKTRIPVYMDFPSATTEVFLESAFKGNLKPKYVKPKEPK